MPPRRLVRARAFWIYLIRRSDGALYAGIAVDVAARLRQHERGQGSKALRGRGPLALALRRRIGPKALALRIEAALKRLRKPQKEALAASPRAFSRWLSAQRSRFAAGAGSARGRTGS
jgi:putative endonuclease